LFASVGTHTFGGPKVSPANANKLDLAQDTGVEIMEVQDGRPAAKADLRPGDILVFLDGKPVKNLDKVQRILDASSIGRSLVARVLRGASLIDLGSSRTRA